MGAPREPRLRLEEIPGEYVAGGVVEYAEPLDRAWWFLDYGDPASRDTLDRRWYIVARREHEDFQVICNIGSMHERTLGLIPHEMELAREAIAAIRSASAESDGAQSRESDGAPA